MRDTRLWARELPNAQGREKHRGLLLTPSRRRRSQPLALALRTTKRDAPFRRLRHPPPRPGALVPPKGRTGLHPRSPTGAAMPGLPSAPTATPRLPPAPGEGAPPHPPRHRHPRGGPSSRDGERTDPRGRTDPPATHPRLPLRPRGRGAARRRDPPPPPGVGGAGGAGPCAGLRRR